MINAADVHLEYHTGITLKEGASCIFSVRLTYEGAGPVAGLEMWFRAGSTEQQHKELPTLSPGRPYEEHFAWEATAPGTIPIRIALGIPENVPPADERHLTVYTRSLRADGFPAPKTPQSLSQTFNFGRYQVGDIGAPEGGSGRKITGRGRRRSYAPADAARDSDWEALELFENDRETLVRRFEQLFQWAEASFIKGRLAAAAAQTREEIKSAVTPLMSARQQFLDASHFAIDVLGFMDRATDCERRIREIMELVALLTRQLGPDSPPPRPPGAEAGGVLRRAEGAALEVYVLTKPTVTWGRHSQRDVFLAQEPFERPPGEPPWNLRAVTQEQRNYARSTDLSRHHLDTRWREKSPEIIDQSKHGIWLERLSTIKRLPEGHAAQLAHGDRLHLAGSPGASDGPVLSLEVFYPGLGFGGATVHDRPTGFGRGAPLAPRAVCAAWAIAQSAATCCSAKRRSLAGIQTAPSSWLGRGSMRCTPR